MNMLFELLFQTRTYIDFVSDAQYCLPYAVAVATTAPHTTPVHAGIQSYVDKLFGS